MENKIALSENINKEVYKTGNHVERPVKPWSESVFRLLNHFETSGLPVEHIIKIDGNVEITQFIEGEMVHPHKWTDDALFKIGQLTASLHRAAKSFKENKNDIWQNWCLRELGSDKDRILCHGDIAPWNIITENGYHKLLIDWEYAGPLDPYVELARICWLFPQLVDDDLQKLYDLPEPKKRAEQVRIIADGYELSAFERKRMVDRIIEVIICETAHEAIDPSLTFDSSGCLWGFAWRTRSLYWVWRNQEILRAALK